MLEVSKFVAARFLAVSWLISFIILTMFFNYLVLSPHVSPLPPPSLLSIYFSCPLIKTDWRVRVYLWFPPIWLFISFLLIAPQQSTLFTHGLYFRPLLRAWQFWDLILCGYFYLYPFFASLSILSFSPRRQEKLASQCNQIFQFQSSTSSRPP